MKKKLGFVLALLLLIPSLAMAVDLANVKYGGQVRLRGYAFDNVWDFNDAGGIDEWDVFRLKASVWTSVDVGDNITAYVKLTNQNYGEGVTGAEGKTEVDNVSNKVFLDNAYIDAKNVLGPVSLRLGRQNLIYGTGFVILDGQSQFASTSIFFDGVKASMNITDNISIDAFYMKDQENIRWNTPEDDDITLMGIYLTAKGCPVIGGQQEFYALNREDENFLDAAGTIKSQKDIWMYGFRMSDKLDSGLDYSGEIAIQKGTAFNGSDQDALGYKMDLGYTFNIDLKPRIFGQYAFMSGDEAGTADYEGWDVFYGGWPQFGDLLAWKYVNIGDGVIPNAGGNPAAPILNAVWNPGSTVGGEAPYTNLSVATIGVSCVIDGKIFPKVSYSKLRFDEDVAAVAGVTNMDDDFGDYYQISAKYQYSKALSFSLYYAMIQPGDAFVNQDDATEFFWEADLRF